MLFILFTLIIYFATKVGTVTQYHECKLDLYIDATYKLLISLSATNIEM